MSPPRFPFVFFSSLVFCCAFCTSVFCAEKKAGKNSADTKSKPTPAATGELVGIEWADDKLLGSPVAISLDNHGIAYVVQTVRRRFSELDIRQHTSWIPTTLSFESVEQRKKFYHEELDASHSDLNKKWLKDRNGDGISDWHDLEVQSELVLRLEDKSGRGTADTRTVFADGFNTEMTGVAAGILWRDGSVYMTCLPSLWKLDDTKGAGVADSKKEIVTGFGPHIAYSGHDMHGLTIGPDGRIYWTIGDKGVNATSAIDGSHAKAAHEGCVLRCEPDGSHFEIFAHGLRNPQELAFDEFGNLFNVDNDGDFPRERERFVYITEQSDSGWRCNWQYRKSDYNPWMDEDLFVPRWRGQAAYITPPLANYSDGPCGFKYNPGTALSEKYRRTFFLTQFPGRKLTAFKVEPVGAYFKMTNERLVFIGPMMTGINWGPDGALYVADWNSAIWDPHEKGKIWKLDARDARDTLRAETQKLLADGMKNRGTGELATLLGHADQRVRLAAQFELAKRDDAAALLEAARAGKNQLARIHGIWGVGQLGRKNSEAVEPLVALFADKDDEIRVQATKMIGDAHFKKAAVQVAKLVNEKNPRVQFHAAIALAKIGDIKAIAPVVAMLEKNNDEDAYLRHAGATALAGICADDVSPLAKLASHKSSAVRLAAVVALRKIAYANANNDRHPADESLAHAIAKFLKDSDTLVVAEAARAIHDEYSISGALPALAAMLDEKTIARFDDHSSSESGEVSADSGALAENQSAKSLKPKAARPATGHNPAVVIARRAIGANLRIGGADSAKRLAQFAASNAPATLRAESLLTLATWTKPDVLDRVEGRYRPLDPRPAEQAFAALDPVVEKLLDEKSNSVRQAALQAVAKVGYTKVSERILAMVTDAQQPNDVRRVALDALASLKDSKLDVAIKSALASDDGALRSLALTLLPSVKNVGEEVVPLLEKAAAKGSVAEQQSALVSLGKLHLKESSRALAKWMDKLLAGQVKPSLQLDVLEAVRADGGEDLKAKLARYENIKSKEDPLAPFRETLQGGDAKAGEKIANEHLEAQCVRCHKIKGDGAEVGPDLTHVASRLTREKFLESLIDPNAEIAPGYGVVMVTLKKKGDQLSGVLASETEKEIKLRQLDGSSEQTIAKSDIAEMTKPMSMMPPMGTILTPREIRDVIEFLSKLK